MNKKFHITDIIGVGACMFCGKMTTHTKHLKMDHYHRGGFETKICSPCLREFQKEIEDTFSYPFS